MEEGVFLEAFADVTVADVKAALIPLGLKPGRTMSVSIAASVARGEEGYDITVSWSTSTGGVEEVRSVKRKVRAPAGSVRRVT